MIKFLAFRSFSTSIYLYSIANIHRNNFNIKFIIRHSLSRWRVARIKILFLPLHYVGLFRPGAFSRKYTSTLLNC